MNRDEFIMMVGCYKKAIMRDANGETEYGLVTLEEAEDVIVSEFDRLTAEVERLTAQVYVKPEHYGDCGYCKYAKSNFFDEPCQSCTFDNDKWESEQSQ